MADEAGIDWANVVDAVANVIGKASESFLGILALLALLLSIGVIVLFWKEPDGRYRLAALGLLLVGLAGVAYAGRPTDSSSSTITKMSEKTQTDPGLPLDAVQILRDRYRQEEIK